MNNNMKRVLFSSTIGSLVGSALVMGIMGKFSLEGTVMGFMMSVAVLSGLNKFDSGKWPWEDND